MHEIEVFKKDGTREWKRPELEVRNVDSSPGSVGSPSNTTTATTSASLLQGSGFQDPGIS